MIITADVGAVFNLFIYIWDFLPGANNWSGKNEKKKDNFRQYKNSGKLWSKNMISLALRQFQDQILLTLNHNRFFIPETAISPQY